jgi:mono/diheme cytochrome c family protein
VHDGLAQEEPVPAVESDEDHFLYGSIGAEEREGIPYWVWLVLPRVFPDLLPGPGGYAALGLLSQDGRDMPVGLSKVTIGYPRVAVNCAFCHTASVRSTPDALPRLIVGAPAHQAGAQEYRRFLAAAAADPRFNATTILREIARNYRLSLVERLLYRFVLIPGARERLLRLREATPDDHPDWGRGRADLLTRFKARLARPDLTEVGTSDAPALWNLTSRAGRGLFWDGVHTSLRDAVVASALSEGASRPWLDRDLARWDGDGATRRSSLRRVHDYIATLKPPPYPYPIDAALAASGEAVYRTECAQCHAPDGSRAGEAIPASEVGTDPARSRVWSDDDTAAASAFAWRRDWSVPAFGPSRGYVPVALDGLWLRAPYLHNGSVPSLRDLLEPASRRPSRFWRGYDVYDPVNVGFVSGGPDAQRAATPYDVTRRGNGNAGHEYGATLSEESKRALLEYLKTL